ncbi:unnamed protein product [Urochloa decumbens]|uniref:F-box domain-containing protein n=1 Tax=Urochloa decumbens TaxID=240449 RepID=A0ABC9F2U1_9POAL
MEAAPKRARAGGGSAPDRLSTLPDELLHRVLSFLPSRQAVQTTVLSKRWIDLWRSMPALNLIISEFRSTTAGHYDQERWGKMENFTTNLLMRHRAPRLDAFRLNTGRISGVDWRRDVDRWFRRAMEYCPVVMEIWLSRAGGVRYHLPKLVSCHLKRLNISGVFLERSFAEQLHSGCPVLEDLKIWECRGFRGFQSDTLKNLVAFDCWADADADTDTWTIRAPSLASVCLSLPYYNSTDVLLDTGNSLVEASIRGSLSYYISRRDSQAVLLGSLVNVTSLELSCFNAMVFLDKEFDKAPIFENLRTLSLEECFVGIHEEDKFMSFGRLLQKSPNLEKLTLQNLRVRPTAPFEFPVLENLRTLLLDECDLCGNILLLRHFLRSSPNLEKLTLRLCRLPKVFPGGKGKAKSKKAYCQFQNLVHFKCQKLKSTEIIYREGRKIQGLVSFFLGISGCAPKNTITLTKYEEKRARL